MPRVISPASIAARNASTTSGSNCVPAHRSISAIASSCVERRPVRAARTSSRRRRRRRRARVPRPGSRCPPGGSGSRRRPSARGGTGRTAAPGRATGTPARSQTPSTGCARISASSASSRPPGFDEHLGPDVHLADVVERGPEPQRARAAPRPSRAGRPRPPRSRRRGQRARRAAGRRRRARSRDRRDGARAVTFPPTRPEPFPLDSRRMRVCVPRESAPGEHRVALTPEAVSEAHRLGLRAGGRARRGDDGAVHRRGVPRGRGGARRARGRGGLRRDRPRRQARAGRGRAPGRRHRPDRVPRSP